MNADSPGSTDRNVHLSICTILYGPYITGISGTSSLKIPNESKSCTLFESAFERYELIMNRGFKETSKIPKTLVKVAVENCDEIPHQYMNETYRVAISYDEIKITAATEWGILRGLETLGLAHFRFIF